MQGKIMKGIAGFYYVHIPNKGIYECKARGVFRNKKIKPLVGDNVELEILDEKEYKGNITKILPRINELYRPLVANIDQVIVVFAVADPSPNYYLLDRFLVAIEKEQLEVNICFNKIDRLPDNEIDDIVSKYELAGYKVFLTSATDVIGIDNLKGILTNKTTVFAGPSGVGKSSLLNDLQDNIVMETGEISKKIKRGKHTTRHAELIAYDENSYIVDTPGFSNLHLEELTLEELRQCFIEFGEYEDHCRFKGCAHINEPNCAVKEAVEDEKIVLSRYESYKMIYTDIKEQRRW